MRAKRAKSRQALGLTVPPSISAAPTRVGLLLLTPTHSVSRLSVHNQTPSYQSIP
jgi:hypothetical protein